MQSARPAGTEQLKDDNISQMLVTHTRPIGYCKQGGAAGGWTHTSMQSITDHSQTYGYQLLINIVAYSIAVVYQDLYKQRNGLLVDSLFLKQHYSEYHTSDWLHYDRSFTLHTYICIYCTMNPYKIRLNNLLSSL